MYSTFDVDVVSKKIEPAHVVAFVLGLGKAEEPVHASKGAKEHELDKPK